MEFQVSVGDRFSKSSTSKGNQLKWVFNNVYVKADTMGYESIAEALSSEFFRYVEGIDYVDYFLCTAREKNVAETFNSYECCFSRSFLNGGESCVSIQRLLELSYRNLEKQTKKLHGREFKDFVVKTVWEVTGLDIEQYLCTLLTLDAITLNEDRHLNNIVVIQKGDAYRFAPIFDNGLSLLSDTSDYPLDENSFKLIALVKSKPFNRDFCKQLEYFDFKPLIVDFKSFEKDVRGKDVPFKKAEYRRALDVLLFRLRSTEGRLWIQK